MSQSEPRARLESWLMAGVLGVSLAYLALWLTNVVAFSLVAGFDFQGAPADGPFQLFNPLRRLAAGQLAGRDFQFFHGILVPFLHYPVFALFGRNLVASEFARQLISPVATMAGFLVAWRWVTGAWREAVVLTAVSVASLDVTMADTLYASNSLLAIRTIFPVLACAALTLRGAPWRAGLLFGVLAAISVLSGTEQGAALMSAAVPVLGLEWLWRRTPAARQRCLGAMLGFMATLPALLLIVTRGSLAGALRILRFNFLELGEDQLWYFGSDPGEWLSSWRVLLSRPYPWTIALMVLAPAGYLLWQRRRFSGQRADQEERVGLIDAGMIFALYGLITLLALLAIYISKNVHTCARSALFVVLALSYFGLRRRSGGWLERWRPWLASAAVFGIIAFALALPRPEKPLQATLSGIASKVRLATEAVARGARLSPAWSSVLQTFAPVLAKKQHPILWSTYTGLPEAHWGLFHPDTDYIIHALGRERRRQYLERFDEVQPDFVQTQVASDLFQFEGWLQSTSWPFYERLLRRYIPVTTTYHSLIWRQRLPGDPAVAFGPVSSLKVERDHTIHVPAPPPESGALEPRLAVVHLNYRVTNTLKWLPLLGKSTHLIVTIRDAWDVDRVPLNPNETEVSFPVHFKPDQQATLEVKAEGLLPGTSIWVEAADATYLSLPAAYAPFATSGLRKKPDARLSEGPRLAAQPG